MNTKQPHQGRAREKGTGVRGAKAIVLALSIALAGSGAATSAHATTPLALAAPTVAQGADSIDLAASSELTGALTQLVESDYPRSTVVRDDAVEHTFALPVLEAGESHDVSVTVGIPIDDRLGAGSDRHGPYYLLNNFDQQVIANGAAATVAAGLCAIPAVGTVSCVAIQAAIAVAAAWISQHGLCPQNLKGYFFNNGIRPSCVKY